MSEMNGNGKWPLPEGWVEVTLADVAHVERGITFPASAKSSELFGGGIACLRTTNVQEFVDWSDLIFVPEKYVRKEEKLTRPNDILISMANSYELVGKVSFVDHVPVPSTFGGFIASIRTFESISPKFLFYFLRNKETQSFLRRNSSQTVNIANISLHSLYPTPIPLPTLSQQHRIVAEIEKQFTRLDAAVAALKRAKANLGRYKSAVLKAAVEGRLVAQNPDDEPAAALLARILTERRAQWVAANPKKPYAEPKRPDVAGLPELPVGWVWATVEEVGDSAEQPVLTGPFGSSLGRDDFISQGVPLLTIGCLKETGITLDKAFYVSEEKAVELDRYRVREGDILFSRMAAVGRAGYIPASLEGSLINYHLMRLRLNVQSINPDYFIYYVRGSNAVESYIREVNHGVTRDGINTTQLLSLPVALPPKFEQERIVEEVERILSVAQASEQVIYANFARAERLRQGVLGKAFRGELVTSGDSETSEVF